MAVLQVCPSCGLQSGEIRCPRCNALKVIGCTGSCALCGSNSTCKTSPGVEPASRPSDGAVEDDEHPGTPLER